MSYSQLTRAYTGQMSREFPSARVEIVDNQVEVCPLRADNIGMATTTDISASKTAQRNEPAGAKKVNNGSQRPIIGKETLIPLGVVIALVLGAYSLGQDRQYWTGQVRQNTEAVKALPQIDKRLGRIEQKLGINDEEKHK